MIQYWPQAPTAHPICLRLLSVHFDITRRMWYLQPSPNAVIDQPSRALSLSVSLLHQQTATSSIPSSAQRRA
jgi:hypothetical protein